MLAHLRAYAGRYRAWRQKRGDVQPLFSCSHRNPDGSSAWGPCTWWIKGWYAQCSRCGDLARCR